MTLKMGKVKTGDVSGGQISVTSDHLTFSGLKNIGHFRDQSKYVPGGGGGLYSAALLKEKISNVALHHI